MQRFLPLLRAVVRVLQASLSLVPDRVRRVLAPVVLVLGGFLGGQVLLPDGPVLSLSPEDVVDTAPAPALLEEWVDALVAAVDLDKPVTVLVAPLRQWGNLGRLWDQPERYLVVLDDALEPDLLAQTLIHELAHALSPGDFEHGEEWGRAYSRVYRAWLTEVWK